MAPALASRRFVAGASRFTYRELYALGIPLIALAIGFGSSWLATILWNMASQRLPASLCGQLIVSETLFALLYSFVWDHRWPTAVQWAAVLLFTTGILASIKAHK